MDNFGCFWKMCFDWRKLLDHSPEWRFSLTCVTKRTHYHYREWQLATESKGDCFDTGILVGKKNTKTKTWRNWTRNMGHYLGKVKELFINVSVLIFVITHYFSSSYCLYGHLWPSKCLHAFVVATQLLWGDNFPFLCYPGSTQNGIWTSGVMS